MALEVTLEVPPGLVIGKPYVPDVQEWRNCNGIHSKSLFLFVPCYKIKCI